MTLVVSLYNIRSYKFFTFTLNKGPNLVWGPNGSGKTNLLESISLFAQGQSMRGAKLEDILTFEESCGAVSATLTEGLIQNNVSINIGKSKVFTMNNSKITAAELSKLFSITWLTPFMIFNFWRDGRIRRNLIDRIASNIIPLHGQYCAQFEKSRRLLNGLYFSQSTDLTAYRSIEKIMIEAGVSIIQNRNIVIQKLNQLMQEKNFDCQIKMDSGTELLVSELWLDKLELLRQRHIPTNSIGPHRCDIILHLRGVESNNCSTGEQHMCLINIIFASFDLFRQNTRILLLDDIISHLDQANNALVFDLINNYPKDYILLSHHSDLPLAGNKLTLRLNF